VVNPKNNDGSNNRYEQAVYVQARHAVSTEHAEEKASDDCAHNSENNIEKDTFSALVNDLAAYKPGDKA
jgi:hypothetical protein